ncbi:hypothetical protein EVAR_86392_1 [Eumeta japonica]|uniref:Uncharacterized protein n=1 Tax=Eumeta variegata TaxID=151549 RepID=A0A4C1W8W4_EUMVA|nr:hypothetical protein EVAR_86392_1 [Eumeta japonica]
MKNDEIHHHTPRPIGRTTSPLEVSEVSTTAHGARFCNFINDVITVVSAAGARPVNDSALVSPDGLILRGARTGIMCEIHDTFVQFDGEMRSSGLLR